MNHRSRAPRSSLARSMFALALVAAIATLSGCQKSGAKEEKEKLPPALQLAAEDKLVMGQGEFSSGPLITGAVQAERRADLRAEVAAVVQQVLKDNGEFVHKGDLLVRLDATSIRDSLSSAEEAVRAARDTFDQTDRQFQRQKTLQAQGMVSIQAMEDAQNRRAAAMSEKVAADARLVAARQQMSRTEARAPFDGVVSERQVSAGDTAQVGKALLKVIDPSSMRFEGYVSADQRASLQLGQAVDLKVNGMGNGSLEGKIRRIDVAADPVSRQVAVIVDFANPRVATVAGLYGEGHVRTTSTAALMLGESDLQRDGDSAFAWVVKDSKLHRQPIKLGERDARSGDYVVTSGLAIGDVLIRNPSRTLVEDTPIQAGARASAPAASSPKGA